MEMSVADRCLAVQRFHVGRERALDGIAIDLGDPEQRRLFRSAVDQELGSE